jgi:hypothetical protein
VDEVLWMSILVVTMIEAREGRLGGYGDDGGVYTRVNRLGITSSNTGRRYGQHATMIPVLIWAIDQRRAVPIPYVTSLP